jgi:hypothetical protein
MTQQPSHGSCHACALLASVKLRPNVNANRNRNAYIILTRFVNIVKFSFLWCLGFLLKEGNGQSGGFSCCSLAHKSPFVRLRVTLGFRVTC